MFIFPAIDLKDGKAVRLLRGDYNKVTVYGDEPLEVAKSFKAAGAQYLHIVDLDGAKDGTTANFETIKKLIEKSGLSAQVGGGVRSVDVVKKYLDAGAARVILGTAAVTDPNFLSGMAKKYGAKIAVGVDIRDGYVSTHGWRQQSNILLHDFCTHLEDIGVKTVICTDISKDGAMSGTNMELYKEMSEKYSFNTIASGGVSSIDDVKKLADMGLYGAILGKAVYTGAIELSEAVRAGKEFRI